MGALWSSRQCLKVKEAANCERMWEGGVAFQRGMQVVYVSEVDPSTLRYPPLHWRVKN